MAILLLKLPPNLIIDYLISDKFKTLKLWKLDKN